MRVLRGGVHGLGPCAHPSRYTLPKRIVRVSQSSSNGARSNGASPVSVAERLDTKDAAVLVVDRPQDARDDAMRVESQNGAAAVVVNGNGNGANGASAWATPLDDTAARSANGASAPAAPPIPGDMDPCEAGQLEACANIKFAEREQQEQQATRTSGSAPSSSASAGNFDTPYAQAGYSSIQRTFQIYSFALTFAWRYMALGRKGTYKGMEGGMTPENVSQKKRELAKWLREGLIRLGPTFIKIGQQFSTRVDVLSREFIEELEQLQDNVPQQPRLKSISRRQQPTQGLRAFSLHGSDTAVPAFGAAAVRQTIEDAFGKRVEEVFEEFDFEPIAAASLGQVHLACLRGRRVVVKVQRPGLKALFDVDLKNVRVIAQWLQRLDPKSDGAARDWVAIYDECSRILYEEIDYTAEAAYAREFAQNFKGTEWVKVPEIYEDYLSSDVLVMEYVPGVKINNGDAIDAMGLDRDRLARLAVESYLQQLLRYGLFHADPHPGNVAVDATNGGRLIYYDFGMMGRIQPNVRAGLRDLFFGVYNKDADACLDALETMGVFKPGGDRTAVRRTAVFFLNSFSQRLKEQAEERKRLGAAYSEDFKGQRSKEDSKERRKQILSNIGEDLLIASADKPFRFPAEFTFVVRSFTVLDGIGKSLSKRFDISEISAPYARELVFAGKTTAEAAAERFQAGLKRQERAVKGLFDGPIKIDELVKSFERLENGETKPRVRALEVERAVQRMSISQSATLCLVAASMCMNVGTVLSVSALPVGAAAGFTGAAIFGVLTLIKFLKVKGLEKKELQIAGQA